MTLRTPVGDLEDAPFGIVLRNQTIGNVHKFDSQSFDTSFGFSIGDFTTAAQLAWTVYRACSGAGERFRRISGEVK